MRSSFVLFTAIFAQSFSAPTYNFNDFRAEFLFYNESLVSDMSFNLGKINRTTVAVNASFNLLHDLEDDNMMISSELEKLYRTEYKKAGIRIVMNVCKYIKTNMMGIKDLLARYTNIDGCHLPKGGYYVRNLVPDLKSVPPFIPTGSYRTETDLFWKNGGHIFKFMTYWTVTESFWNGN